MFRCVEIFTILLAFCWSTVGASVCNGQCGSEEKAPNDYAISFIHQRFQPFVVNNTNEKYLFNEKRRRRSVFLLKLNASEKYTLESYEKPAVNNSRTPSRPKFFISRNISPSFDPKAYMCREKTLPSCRNKTTTFRNRVLSEFRKSLEDVVKEPNFYNVQFKPFPDSPWNKAPTACMIVNSDVRVLRRRSAPFIEHSYAKIFPKKRLFKNFQNVKSCAIISSAGSLLNSSLGRFIDLHDIVMRFNHAPVEGYESDVGSKTTIRVVNSQVVSKPVYNFVEAKIFQNITIAAWDPGKYNVSLKDWFNNADFNLFTNYEKYRKKYPKSSTYLIDPHSIWRLWETLQEYTELPIRRNPPSSGFIGLALLLPYCPYVDFIEYVPSTRLNGRCHYYSKEMNSACTFGAWHPLAAEKLMALNMNIADDFAVFQNGITRIRRPSGHLCESSGY